jgi:hypothetical protein
MFSFLNSIIDLNKKQADYMMELMPDSAVKSAVVNFNKANLDLAYKSVELADSYAAAMKKVLVK